MKVETTEEAIARGVTVEQCKVVKKPLSEILMSQGEFRKMNDQTFSQPKSKYIHDKKGKLKMRKSVDAYINGRELDIKIPKEAIGKEDEESYRAQLNIYQSMREA